MHQIRTALRGKGVVLMGKNTMVRRALRNILAENPQFERLLPHVKGNIGFVFTSGDLKDIREIIIANKVKAPARAGAIATVDVTVPAGNTGMEPGKTSFFQALSIPTKIARGTIEITMDIKVVHAGTRVGPSEATLLNMLNISPFTYGMTVAMIYDNGTTFPPHVLDIEESELIDKFLTGIKTIACISLALHYPTIVSISHSLVNAYKNVLAIAVETEYSFPAADKVRSYVLKYPFLPPHIQRCTIKTLKIPSFKRNIGDPLGETLLSMCYTIHAIISFFSYHSLLFYHLKLTFLLQIKEYLANPEAFAAAAAPAAGGGGGGAAAAEEAPAKEEEPAEDSDDDMVCIIQSFGVSIFIDSVFSRVLASSIRTFRVVSIYLFNILISRASFPPLLLHERLVFSVERDCTTLKFRCLDWKNWLDYKQSGPVSPSDHSIRVSMHKNWLADAQRSLTMDRICPLYITTEFS